jgi:predicted dehydrogenase
VADEQVSAVVVGTSYGVLTHVRALRQAGFAVVGLLGRNATKTKERAEVLDIPHAFADLDEALELPGVDVVAVATPPHTHAGIVLASIAAQKHVVCEKPFALDVPEAQTMLDAAERAGIVHMLGTEFRFATGQALLQRVVTSGTIGEPRAAVFVSHMPSLVDPIVELPDWWESAAQGGGWLGAFGSHTIDQIRSTIGELAAVSASLQTLAPRPAMTADDTYTVHFECVDGCTGVLHASCAIPGASVTTTKIGGTHGAAWLAKDEVWVDTGAGAERVPDPPDLARVPHNPPPMSLQPAHAEHTKWHTSGRDLAPYTRLFARLRARILGEPVADDPPAATFADGVANQAVLDAARRSAAGGGWVGIDRP